MKKISTTLVAAGFAAAITLASFPTASMACAPFGGCGQGGEFGTGELDYGAFCLIKEVTVLTATPEDCAKIGGKTTHEVKTVATPVE